MGRPLASMSIINVFIAVGAALIIYLMGAAMIRSFNSPPPGDPDPTDVEPVDYRFRCEVCGTLVTMTAAPTAAVPEAPRHCREDMTLVVEQGL